MTRKSAAALSVLATISAISFWTSAASAANVTTCSTSTSGPTAPSGIRYVAPTDGAVIELTPTSYYVSAIEPFAGYSTGTLTTTCNASDAESYTFPFPDTETPAQAVAQASEDAAPAIVTSSSVVDHPAVCGWSFAAPFVFTCSIAWQMVTISTEFDQNGFGVAQQSYSNGNDTAQIRVTVDGRIAYIGTMDEFAPDFSLTGALTPKAHNVELDYSVGGAWKFLAAKVVR